MELKLLFLTPPPLPWLRLRPLLGFEGKGLRRPDGLAHLALAPQNQSSPASWDNASRPFAHELWGVYPVLGEGFALLGELGKFVGVSETRFADLSVATDAMTVRVRGDPGEVVTVTAAVPKGSGQQNLGLRVLTAVLPQSGGEASLSFRRLPQ